MINYTTTTYPSKLLKIDWNVSYIHGDKNYPILYFLHGATGNHTNFYEYTQLQKFINQLNYKGSIVFVDGFNSFYIDQKMQMESALIQELMPAMEEQLQHNQKRVIAGISMGGFGALHLALKYQNHFQQCFAISPAIWNNPQNSLLKDWQLFQKEGHFNLDLWQKEHPLAYLKPSNTEFLLINNKQDEITPYLDTVSFYNQSKDILNINLIIEEQGAHNWMYWNQHIPTILKAIQSKIKPSQILK